MIDFHTHLLSHMDDGAKDDTQSQMMVDDLIAQGVSQIVCTPHYYPFNESMEEFTARRNARFDKLMELYSGRSEIEFIKGAEVYCSDTLEFASDLSALCIGSTSYILVELPFVGTVSARVQKILSLIIDKFALTPVIAHAERYPSMRIAPLRNIRKLRALGCKIQINCDSIIDKRTARYARRLIGNGLIDVLGSDCHEPGRRPPHMKAACDVITADFGEDQVIELMDNARRMISRKEIAGQPLYF
ncbi:MAG: CpsB/CapC family capsule biosynthesis tyrosine phosphatase [Saccharofermentanales bacterium]